MTETFNERLDRTAITHKTNNRNTQKPRKK